MTTTKSTDVLEHQAIQRVFAPISVVADRLDASRKAAQRALEAGAPHKLEVLAENALLVVSAWQVSER